MTTKSTHSPLPRRFNLRVAAIAVLAGVAAVYLFSGPPLPQSLAYHDFADQRTLLGVPHFANVLSNVPFLLLGLYGVAFLLRRDSVGPGRPFLAGSERWPYLVLFAGIGLTAFGSAWYHLAPSNERLLW